MGLKVFKVNALPETLVANAMYMIPNGATDVKLYLTNNTGTVARVLTALADFTSYSLPIGTGTGAIDLSVNQIYKVSLTAAGQKTISFTNAPTEAMTIVIEAVGNVGTIVFPAGVVNVTGVTNTLGSVKTLFVLFWDTEKYYIINVAKIDA
jgi:hypothetical protein